MAKQKVDPRAPKRATIKGLNDYLEVMSKYVFQSGMSTKVVESKWPGIREAFAKFNIKKVAAFTDKDILKLTSDERVIRNKVKLKAIVSNAQVILEKDKECKGFKKYLRSHDDFGATLKSMKKEFKFLGAMSAYMYLYIVGEKVPGYEEFQKKYNK